MNDSRTTTRISLPEFVRQEMSSEPETFSGSTLQDLVENTVHGLGHMNNPPHVFIVHETITDGIPSVTIEWVLKTWQEWDSLVKRAYVEQEARYAFNQLYQNLKSGNVIVEPLSEDELKKLLDGDN